MHHSRMSRIVMNKYKNNSIYQVLDLGGLGLDAGDGLLERGVDGVLSLAPHEPASIHPSILRR